MSEAVGWVAVGLGVALLVVSAVGLFRLPDALSRQHAATKSTTLALGLLLVGAAWIAGDPAWWLRVATILLFLVVTLPVASQVLARAAARERYQPEDLRDADRVEADEP